MKQYRDILLTCAAIFATRIPFLFSGYGSEEDAWGLILTARKIDLNGVYEVSRMPGHPVQEYLLSLIWNWPSWILNLLTALISTAGIGVFMACIKKMHIRQYLESGIALAFVPAVYLNSSNVMDYTWAMTITMVSFLLCLRQKPLAAGVVLGIAAGFRVTALGMAVPLALLFLMNGDQKTGMKNILMFWVTALIVAVTAFLPPYLTYGPSFFMYYQYFPDPPLLKNIFKATIGAWGTIGFLAVSLAVPAAVIAWKKNKPELRDRYLLVMCVIVMAMYLFAYYKLPQKSAFVIPAAPYVILFCAVFLQKKAMRMFAGSMIISSLLFGINLNDPKRGSDPSSLSIPFTAAGSSSVFDILCGPVPADLTKRKNKIEYARHVSETILSSGKNTLLIAGWYQNEIEYYLLDKSRETLVTVYYASEEELAGYRQKGFQILHLPEQDIYNDLRYKGEFTSRFSVPFPGALSSEP